MADIALPLSGVSYGQQLMFHGIHQRTTFPAHVTSDYTQVLARARETYPFQAVVVMYDQAVPGASQFVDGISGLVNETLIKLPLEAGEHLKTPEQIARVTQILEGHGIGEKSISVIIGGGTVCNFAGFLSTIWHGMEPIVVPTNYTAMGDVAIGSLHMLNVGADKNRLRLYYDPLAVVFDPRFITTLTNVERRNGLVETVKHAIAQDVALLEHLERHVEAGTVFNDDTVFDFALRTAQLKDELIGIDPFGERTQNILLYGHVMAHAIEPASDYSIPHGEAVSLGLLAELAFFHGPTTPIFTRVKALMNQLGLPIKIPSDLHISTVMDHLAHVMTRDDTLLIPRVEGPGALKSIGGLHTGEFDRASIQKALNSIAS